MKLEANISSKAATSLALVLAIGAFAAPSTGFAQETHNSDCRYKTSTQSTSSVQAPVSSAEYRPTDGHITGPTTVSFSPLETVAYPVQDTLAVAPDTVKVATVLTAASVVPQPSSTAQQHAVNSGPASSESTHVAPRMLKDSDEAGQLRKAPVRIAQVETASKSAMQDKMSEKSKMMAEKPNLWRNVLVNHTNKDADGLVRFDYASLKASPNDMAALNSYIDELAAQKPSTFESKEAMAYWANLYNALTVRIVAENYPVKSIRKIKSGLLPGPWKRDLVTVEGEELSLDNIEHDIMRPTFKTPLVHYMVNCASIGCPNLKETPWDAKTLDADLEVAARAFVNSPRGVTLNSKGRLAASSIYKWFQKDFGGSQQGVLEHLAQYANEDTASLLKGRTKIDKFEYDWGVNAP